MSMSSLFLHSLALFQLSTAVQPIVIQSDSSPSDVLHADLTCCRQHADSQDGCEQETGSSCVWLSPYDPIAIQYGQCLGQAFYNCKSININGICQGPAHTDCGPAPSPPTCDFCSFPGDSEDLTADKYCYYYDGYPCIISGDPHTKMFNSAVHDFQGQPGNTFNGQLKNQFYYVHACAHSDSNDLPFSILGTLYPIIQNGPSAIDYIVIELYDNADTYYVYLSSALRSYARNGNGISTDYDVTAETMPYSLTSLTDDETVIGSRFKLRYEETGSDQDELIKITLTIDNEFEVVLEMEAQGVLVDDRYRMHYVSIEQSAKYKCFTCGLCGNFRFLPSDSESVLEEFEMCDGSVTSIESGSDYATNPASYDPNGWSWEYEFSNNECNSYDINAVDDFGYADPCNAVIKQDVIDACAAARAERESCCEILLDGAICDELEADCEYDACVLAEGDVNKIGKAVGETFTKEVNALCSDPDARELYSDKNLETRTRNPTPVRTSRPTNTKPPTRAEITRNPTPVKTSRPTNTPPPTNTMPPTRGAATSRPTNTAYPTRAERTPRPTNTAYPTRSGPGRAEMIAAVKDNIDVGILNDKQSDVDYNYVQIGVMVLMGMGVLLCLRKMRCEKKKEDEFTPLLNNSLKTNDML